jgi:hypothetical protein
MINLGDELDAQTRFDNVEPAINTFRLLQSTTSADPRLQRWYCIHLRWDRKFLLLGLEHALECYPPEDKMYLSDGLKLGQA